MSATLPLAIDKTSPIPLYYQLELALKEAIRNGVLTPGAKLEKESELVARLNVSRITVRKAIDHLVAAGLLVRQPHAGTYVAASDQSVAPTRPTPPLFRNRNPEPPDQSIPQ